MKIFTSIVASAALVLCLNSVTADPANDPWDYKLEEVNGRFLENLTPQIILTYDLNSARVPTPGGSEEMRVRVMHKGCPSGGTVSNTIIKPQSIGQSTVRTNPGNNLKSWDLRLSLDTRNMYNDPKFVVGSEFNFEIEMCVYTQLVARDGSEEIIASYDETNVKVELSLSANVDDLRITATADNIGEVDGTATVMYEVETCRCDSNTNCLNNPPAVRANELLRVCVKSKDSRVELLDIKEMNLFQGDVFRAGAVAGRSSDVLTKKAIVNVGNNAVAVVETTLIAAFFYNKGNPDPIDVKGVALMKFNDDRRVRRLEDNADLAGEGEIAISVNLDYSAASGAFSTMSMLGLSLLSAIAATLTI